MKGAWFVVTCKVDNGCRIETWKSIVYAENAMDAMKIAKADWEVRDNETVAEVQAVRMIYETEIFTMQVR